MIPVEILRLPYEPYSVSPTIKEYTMWKFFDEYYRALANNEIIVGGEAPAPNGYDIVYAGTRIVSMTDDVDVVESNPLGIINPHRDKATLIHYYLRPKTYRIQVDGEEKHIAFTIPVEKTITPQHLVVSASGSSRLHVDVLGGESRSLRSMVLEIGVEEDSRLELYVNVEDTANAPSLIMIGARLAEKSKLEIYYMVRPGKMTRLILTTVADGRDSRVNVRGTTIATGTSRLDNIVDLIDRAENTYSTLVFTGLAYDQSQIAQRGVGKITEEARDAGVEYYSEALILSRDARFYAQPRLEIDNGRIKTAKHAAHNTHILPDQVFYLETRGIPRDEAQKMIIKGFLTKQIESRYARKWLESHVSKTLEDII